MTHWNRQIEKYELPATDLGRLVQWEASLFDTATEDSKAPVSHLPISLFYDLRLRGSKCSPNPLPVARRWWRQPNLMIVFGYSVKFHWFKKLLTYKLFLKSIFFFTHLILLNMFVVGLLNGLLRWCVVKKKLTHSLTSVTYAYNLSYVIRTYRYAPL